MVFPVGDPVLDLEPVPAVIREVHAPFWYLLLVLLLALVILQICAMSFFAAIYTSITAIVVWYMVKDSFKEMKQYCLLLFGLMCAIQAIFDTIILFTMIGGRREQKTEKEHHDENTVTYKTTVTTHPFFDESMGTVYNLQSLTRVISPILMLMAALLSYWSNSAYTTDLFGDDYGESRPVLRRDDQPGGYGGAPRGYPGGGQRLGDGRGTEGPPGRDAPPRQPGRGFAPFHGTGQRLGNGDA